MSTGGGGRLRGSKDADYPHPPPPGASGKQLVAKGTDLRSPWVPKVPDSPWAPTAPKGNFYPFCNPTQSLIKTERWDQPGGEGTGGTLATSKMGPTRGEMAENQQFEHPK